jgi:hypothetical protein
MENNDMKIAILVPSRGRPDGLYRLFESVSATISGENEIQFIIGIDRDDPYKARYYDVLDRMEGSEMTVFMDENNRRPIAKIWNSLFKISTAEWFFPGGDDLIFKTKNWDSILVQKIKEQPHPFYLFYFNDSVHGEKLATFPIVSKYWIRTLGYLYPEIFKHNYIDTWLFDIACKLGTQFYIPEVITEHIHFSVNSNVVFDQTYADGLKDNALESDAKLFEDTESMRLLCVEEIKEKICVLS